VGSKYGFRVLGEEDNSCAFLDRILTYISASFNTLRHVGPASLTPLYSTVSTLFAFFPEPPPRYRFPPMLTAFVLRLRTEPFSAMVRIPTPALVKFDQPRTLRFRVRRFTLIEIIFPTLLSTVISRQFLRGVPPFV